MESEPRKGETGARRQQRKPYREETISDFTDQTSSQARRPWRPQGEGRPDHQVARLDAGEAVLDQQASVLSLQGSTGGSPGPQVDALASILRDLAMDDHIGDLQALAGAQHPVDLRDDRLRGYRCRWRPLHVRAAIAVMLRR